MPCQFHFHTLVGRTSLQLFVITPKTMLPELQTKSSEWSIVCLWHWLSDQVFSFNKGYCYIISNGIPGLFALYSLDLISIVTNNPYFYLFVYQIITCCLYCCLKGATYFNIIDYNNIQNPLGSVQLTVSTLTSPALPWGDLKCSETHSCSKLALASFRCLPKFSRGTVAKQHWRREKGGGRGGGGGGGRRQCPSPFYPSIHPSSCCGATQQQCATLTMASSASRTLLALFLTFCAPGCGLSGKTYLSCQ